MSAEVAADDSYMKELPMGCLMFVIALFLPRVAIVLIFLLTNWFEQVFDVWIWPVLGFIFLPYTTLVYMGAILNAGEMTLGWLIIMVIAIMVDIGHWGGGYHHRRRAAVVER